jgi:chromate transporter
MHPIQPTQSLSHRLAQVTTLFLKLGITAFGGPAAHIAMMHDETVRRRKWLSEQEFLDLVGATNLIPGPNSTEMAIHLGYLRAGWLGLIVGGLSFILPAMFMVMGLAWAYVQYGTTPQVEWLLCGVKPVVIAIIIQALWNLGQKAIKSRMLAAVGVMVLIAYFFGVNEIFLLFAGGLLTMMVTNWQRLRKQPMSFFLIPIFTAQKVLSLFTMASVPFSLPLLFFTFLKIGAVLYGSGYVLLAFLRADFVVRLGWLTDKQMIDAVAIGQVTPGPVFTAATFIGFILGGVPGALLATLGIFLPGFIFVAMVNPLIPQIRNSPWANSLLDGVNVASLGLMAAVTWQLGKSSLIDLLTVLVATISFVLIVRFKINSTWLILGGAIVGLGYAVLS